MPCVFSFLRTSTSGSWDKRGVKTPTRIRSSNDGIAKMAPVLQPGEFPYTRGIHKSMYRERLWTMRQFSGFATAEETNARYRYLLSQGQTGLSVAFDLPTLMGVDADDPTALGEVGKCGVAVSTLADMET